MGAAAAQQMYRDFLSKAGGEGSRGGHILGHTAQGKPIYGEGHKSMQGLKYHKHSGDFSVPHDAHVHNREHVIKQNPSYSASDHRAVAAKHTGQAKRATNKINAGDKSSDHYKTRSFHEAAYHAHKDASSIVRNHEAGRGELPK